MRFKILLKTTALTALLLFVANIGWGQVTYVWNQTSGGVYNTASNWTPTRTTPAATDILTFSDGGTYTVTGVPASETIGQLVISNNTKVTLQASATATLTIAGGSGTDLDISSGCELNLAGTNIAITITLSSGATGSISGNMTFAGASAATAHRLTAASVSAITFNSGSIFTAETNFSGSAFGSVAGNANTIIFANGSKYVAKAGSNPFGISAPASAVIFQAGSIYSLEAALTPALSNRTYADFVVNYTGAAITPSGTAPLRVDNLSVLSGTVNITTALPILISNNLNISSGATFNYSPASTNTTGMIFCGNGIQTVNNAGTLTLGANANIIVKESSNVQLSSNITILGKTTVAGTLNTLEKVISGATGSILSGNSSVSLTGTLAVATNGLTGLTSTTGVEPGMLVSGDAAIPANTFVTSINGTATVYFTNYPTAAVASATLTFSRVAGTIKSGHANGLDGSLTIAGTKNFDANTSFEFNGTAAQTTGVLLPSAVKNLTINNAAGVTLSNDLTVNGILTMTNGNLALNSKVLTYDSNASLVYNGTSAQSTSGELISAVPALTINNSNNVTLASSASTTTLTFTSGNLLLGPNNLTVGSFVGAGSSNHVVTSGTGFLKMATVGSGNAIYPIGPSTTSYTPVTSTNNTSSDILGVNVRNTITNATVDNEKCVKLEWLANESIPGGNDGNITFTWNATDQGSTFNPAQPVFFGAWDGSKYNLQEVTVSGSDPYSVTIASPATYPPFPVILGNAEAFPATPPTLTAKDANNSVDNNVDINYLWNNPWYDKITEVWVNGVKLTATTDYDLIGVTKAALGTIRLKPSATSNAVLQHSGTWDIAVKATNYTDATLSITVSSGQISSTNTTVSATPTSIDATSTVTVTAKDQYSNPISGYIFKYDATVKNDVATNGESYTVAGTTTTATSNDVDLTATDASGVVTFSIVIPETVDPLDGISVQVQLYDGTTNVKSPIQYFAPSGPTITITATLNEATLNGATVNLIIQNETFVDLTLDKANFTLNHAPAGLSISDITDITSTSAKVVLAFNGTDFDTDITDFNITVPASELTLNILRTSNDLTITAVNLATVTTNATITSNGLTSASWGGNVTADGGATVSQKGICWSTSANPTISDSKTTEGSGIGTFTSSLDGLTAATKYYVRAYATNYDGTQYGDEYNFTTYSPAPLFTATYPKSANISVTSFDVVVNTDAIGKVYFLKLASGAAAPTSATVKSTGTAINIVAASTDYSATISGLTHSTTYDVYFVTENSDATVLMSTPVKVSITTSIPVAPEFTSGYPKSANINQSKFDVVVNTNAVGKVYFLKLASGAAAPTSAVVKSTGVAINVAAASTDYSSTITGLTASTTYDVYFVTENTAYSILMATPIKVSVTTSAIATVTIHDIQYTTDASGDSPFLGQTVTTSGIVTAIKNGTSGTQQAYSIQSGTGEWSAVYVFSSTPTVSIGDNVTITATVKEYYKMTELDPVLNVTIVSSGNTVPAATELTTLAVNNESYEAVLVKVKRATCNSAITSTGTFVVNDGSGDVTIFKSIYSALTLTVNNKYDVTGIIYDYYSSSTSTHLYEIYPRNAADISDVTGINDNQNLNLKVFPNPFSNEIRFEGIENVKRVIITSVTGQVVRNEAIGQVNVISTSELSQGMYIVTFMNDKGEKMNLKMFKQ